MICVSIGRTRHKMVVLEHRALAERGAELVELRLDFLSHLPDLGRLINNRPTPVIITCRRTSDRGRWRESEEQRMTILRSAIVEGVEYVDLEEDIATKIPRYGDTKRIISYHDFDETPDNLEAIHKRMTKLDPDFVKIVTMAHSPSDVIRMLQLVKNASVPTVGFCMGEQGVPSRILCSKYGSPFTYATFSKDRELAPGQLSFDEMKDIYRFDEIDSETEVFGVLGDPIAHSYSPLLHNAAFKQEEINAVYLPFRVAKDRLSQTLQDFDWLKIRGYSVTIPHKEAVITKADYCDSAVKEIRAANTLYRDDGGQWHATNTDYAAALESIKVGLMTEEDGSIDKVSLKGKQVLMLGAGGVARAIGRAVVDEGGALVIASRTHKRTVALAEELGCKQTLWENRGGTYADIVVNCTPVGMHPNVDETPFQENWLREGMLVFDTIYNPETTLLIRNAKQRDCKTVSGIEMFVRQAARQFELFTGREAPLEVMRQAIRKEISPIG